MEINFRWFLVLREITYHKEGDYFIPDLYLAEDEYEKNYHIGKYGHLRLEYLKKYKKANYTIMLLDGTLRKHIIDTDKQVKAKYDILNFLHNKTIIIILVN